MAWHWVLIDLANNLGVGLENIILILVCLGCLVFYAIDFKVGTIMLLLLSGLCTMLFFFYGVNYHIALIIFFMSLVMLAFSFYAVAKVARTGGLI